MLVLFNELMLELRSYVNNIFSLFSMLQISFSTLFTFLLSGKNGKSLLRLNNSFR